MGIILRITWRALLVPSLNEIFLIFPYIFLFVIYLHCETICDVNKNLTISGTREDNQNKNKQKKKKQKKKKKRKEKENAKKFYFICTLWCNLEINGHQKREDSASSEWSCCKRKSLFKLEKFLCNGRTMSLVMRLVVTPSAL